MTHLLVCLRHTFETPTRADIAWRDIEAMLVAIGALREQGSGSRVRFFLKGIFATFHRPHPQKETDKGAVCSVRKFLVNAGVKLC